jgi:hypothetical protein
MDYIVSKEDLDDVLNPSELDIAIQKMHSALYNSADEE